MPRPRNAVPTAELHIRIPPDVLAKLQLYLFSPVLGRIPQGAMAEFISERLREFFSKEPKKCPHCGGEL